MHRGHVTEWDRCTFNPIRSHFHLKRETHGLKKQKAEQQRTGPKQLKLWWQQKLYYFNVKKEEGYKESNVIHLCTVCTVKSDSNIIPHPVMQDYFSSSYFVCEPIFACTDRNAQFIIFTHSSLSRWISIFLMSHWIHRCWFVCNTHHIVDFLVIWYIFPFNFNQISWLLSHTGSICTGYCNMLFTCLLWCWLGC